MDVSHSDTELSLKSFQDSSKKRSTSVASDVSVITTRSRKSSNGKDLPGYVSFRSKSSLSLHLLDVCALDFQNLCKSLVPSISYMNIDDEMSEFISYWVDPIFRLYFLLYLSHIEYSSVFVRFICIKIVFGI